MKKLLSSKSSIEESRVKIVLVGDKNVGKTNFLISYCSSTSAIDRAKSIFNNFNAHLKYKDKVVKLDFWELPAAEEYEKMRQINYPQTDAFFILYSIDNPQSFQNALNLWHTEIKINNYDNNPVVFIGNKTDIRDEIPVNGDTTNEQESTKDKNSLISINEAKDEISEKIGKGTLHFECSALMQIGINEICLETIKSIFERREKNSKADRDNCCFLI